MAGLGCAIENITVAAAAAGSTATVTMHPADAGGALARVTLARGKAGEGADLFAAITKRHTNRGPYAAEPVAAASLAQGEALLASLPRVQLTWLEDAERDRFGDLVDQATAAVIADGAQSDEIDRWWRGTRDEIDRHRDGMTLDRQRRFERWRATLAAIAGDALGHLVQRLQRESAGGRPEVEPLVGAADLELALSVGGVLDAEQAEGGRRLDVHVPRVLQPGLVVLLRGLRRQDLAEQHSDRR